MFNVSNGKIIRKKTKQGGEPGSTLFPDGGRRPFLRDPYWSPVGLRICRKIQRRGYEAKE